MGKVSDHIGNLKKHLENILPYWREESKPPTYYHIQVLAELDDSEQDELERRILPSATRVDEICAKLGVDKSLFKDATDDFVSSCLPSIQDKPITINTNDGPLLEELAKRFGKKRS